MRTIKQARLPREIRVVLRQAAKMWLASEERPRVEPAVVEHWDALVREWVEDRGTPLLVRRSKGRGAVVRHPEGRDVVAVDNSPAHWALSSAVRGERPTLADVKAQLADGSLPVVFALSKMDQERATYSGCLSRSPGAKLLNDAEWKICHISPVGLRTNKGFDRLRLGDLKTQSRLLLSPSNMFAVPNLHGGFGELPDVIAAFQLAALGELDPV